MKITGVEAIPLAVPLRESAPPSPWTGATARQILVRLTTDEGLTGWGECFAYGATLAVASVVEEALAPIVLGQDPTQIAELVDRMHRALMIWGRRGLATSRLRVYASLLRYQTPAHVRQAVSAVVGLGYTAIKLHQVDVESVAGAREVAGDGIELMLDTNCPWTVEEAIRIGRALERFDLRWLEEPVWPPEDYDGLARVRSAIRIPLACGENEATAFGIRAIIDAAAADIVQPSVTKVGGILEMKKIATLAAVTGVTFVPHSYYYGPGLAATLHVVASTPGVPYVEFPPGELAASILAEPIKARGGAVAVPDRPGLGADPDPDVIARYPYRREAARPFYLT